MKRWLSLAVAIVLLAAFCLSAGCGVSPKDNASAGKTEVKEVTLYFGDKEAEKVMPEKRQIKVEQNAETGSLVKALVEELIAGPSEPGHYKTIPPEARVNKVRIDRNTAWIDFSNEMETRHWHGAAGEAMTINSIVNTVTELPDIDRVGLTVEGRPMNIEHAVLEEPVERNESAIGE